MKKGRQPDENVNLLVRANVAVSIQTNGNHNISRFFIRTLSAVIDRAASTSIS